MRTSPVTAPVSWFNSHTSEISLTLSARQVLELKKLKKTKINDQMNTMKIWEKKKKPKQQFDTSITLLLVTPLKLDGN